MKALCTTLLRNFALLLLAILVSGVLPALVQGYGWIDMARKADGISSIGSVLVDAPPCHICDVAREMQEKAPSKEDAPLPTSKTDVLKSLSDSHSATDFLSATANKVDLMFPLPADSRAPRDLKFGPASPPPRV